jgi:predicted DNA-binding transcriptional regulator AlpA
MEKVKSERAGTPMLFPYEPEDFWGRMKELIKEEIKTVNTSNGNANGKTVEYSVTGMHYKPLYKMEEVCTLFDITRPTVYDWIKHGKLKPFKVRSRVYFLWKDIEGLWRGGGSV